MNLQTYLGMLSDEDLINVHQEISVGKVPETGYSRTMMRQINRMIDKGSMCINPTTYRKVYLPTLIKAVYAELAHRYVDSVLTCYLNI